MSQLYPFLLAPQFVERIWGTHDLAPLYQHRRTPEQVPVGEVWLTGDECRVTNGPFAGENLAAMAGRFGCDFVGEAAPRSSRFPLLINFSFPARSCRSRCILMTQAPAAMASPTAKPSAGMFTLRSQARRSLWASNPAPRWRNWSARSPKPAPRSCST